MISVPRDVKRPLPVRPVDGVHTAEATIAATRVPALSHATIMHPLPIERPSGTSDMVGALRDAAFQRMLDRLDVDAGHALADPTL